MEANLSDLAPVERHTLADMVAMRIRQAILEGRLKPGQRLTEPMLAASFDVSRSPVREALSHLKHQGLVVGATSSYVWQPTDTDVDEIFSLRTALECLADEWAVTGHRLGEQVLDELEARIQDLRKAIELSETLSSQVLLEADEAFYDYICEQSGHSRLNRLWRQTKHQRHVLMSYFLRSGDFIAIADEIAANHRSSLDGLRRGDIDYLKAYHKTTNDHRACRIKRMLMKSFAPTGAD